MVITFVLKVECLSFTPTLLNQYMHPPNQLTRNMLKLRSVLAFTKNVENFPTLLQNFPTILHVGKT